MGHWRGAHGHHGQPKVMHGHHGHVQGHGVGKGHHGQALAGRSAFGLLDFGLLAQPQFTSFL